MKQYTDRDMISVLKHVRLWEILCGISLAQPKADDESSQHSGHRLSASMQKDKGEHIFKCRENFKPSALAVLFRACIWILKPKSLKRKVLVSCPSIRRPVSISTNLYLANCILISHDDLILLACENCRPKARFGEQLYVTWALGMSWWHRTFIVKYIWMLAKVQRKLTKA